MLLLPRPPPNPKLLDSKPSASAVPEAPRFLERGQAASSHQPHEETPLLEPIAPPIPSTPPSPSARVPRQMQCMHPTPISARSPWLLMRELFRCASKCYCSQVGRITCVKKVGITAERLGAPSLGLSPAQAEERVGAHIEALEMQCGQMCRCVHDETPMAPNLAAFRKNLRRSSHEGEKRCELGLEQAGTSVDPE